MAQGEQIHISTWPAIWPTSVQAVSRGETATATSELSDQAGQPTKTRANYDNVAANRIRAAANCFENKCFGILCTSHLDLSNIAAIAAQSSDPEYVAQILRDSPRGATMFLDHTGTSLQGYTVDSVTGKKVDKVFLQAEEDILYAELDLDKAIEGKQYHDVVGGYQRLDIFDLKINRTRREPATFTERQRS
jgi:nitrilase